jgi:hypothetical protein
MASDARTISINRRVRVAAAAQADRDSVKACRNDRGEKRKEKNSFVAFERAQVIVIRFGKGMKSNPGE